MLFPALLFRVRRRADMADPENLDNAEGEDEEDDVQPGPGRGRVATRMNPAEVARVSALMATNQGDLLLKEAVTKETAHRSSDILKEAIGRCEEGDEYLAQELVTAINLELGSQASSRLNEAGADFARMIEVLRLTKPTRKAFTKTLDDALAIARPAGTVTPVKLEDRQAALTEIKAAYLLAQFFEARPDVFDPWKQVQQFWGLAATSQQPKSAKGSGLAAGRPVLRSFVTSLAACVGDKAQFETPKKDKDKDKGDKSSKRCAYHGKCNHTTKECRLHDQRGRRSFVPGLKKNRFGSGFRQQWSGRLPSRQQWYNNQNQGQQGGQGRQDPLNNPPPRQPNDGRN
jgi:hypothetical protein